MGIGTKLRFGDYELDSRAGKLSRDDRPVKIQPQPLRVLAVLLERRGEIVSREELKARIWDDATFVEFDQGLNYCIRQIRLALRDDASEPVYIETLPKQGYRFIAPIVADAFPPSAPIPSNGTGDATAASSTVPDQPRRKRSAWRTAAAVVFLIMAGAALWLIGALANSSSTRPLQVTHLSKLTSYPGDEREPAISPDGRSVAFSWSGEKGENYDIYVVQAGGQRPLRLTQDPALDSFPAWSPDGRQIAFVRRKGPMAEILVNSSLGGSERSLYETRMGSQLDLLQHPVLNWSPDGRWIVFSGQSAESLTWRLWALSVETGAAHRISLPEGNVLGDSSPALSPDGKFLAFVRYHGPVAGQILIQALGQKMIPIGTPKNVVTTAIAVHSPVWMGDSKRLLFADRNNIFQWDRNKAAVPIYAAEGLLGGLSLGPEGPDGTRQVVVAHRAGDTDIWEIPLDASGTKAAGAPRALIRSTASENQPDLSPDGLHIAFASNGGGTGEIWVADADGENARPVTPPGVLGASYPKWSPDSKQIAFHAAVPDVAQVFVVDANQGTPRQVTHENPGMAVVSWSIDGRFLYARTHTDGVTIYRLPAAGGPKELLWEGSMQKESIDGTRLFYSKLDTPGIFFRSLEGDLTKNREERLVSDYWSRTQIGGFAPAAGGVYYVSVDEKGRPGPFRFFAFGTGKSTDVAPAVQGLGTGLSVSPDRRRLVFTASAESGSDLLSLELH